MGIGNPILGDDRIGLEVARGLWARLPSGTVDLAEACLGGIELLDILAGRERVVIIDSLAPGSLAPGEAQEIPWADLATRYTPLSPHNAGLLHCLELGRLLGQPMPNEVRVFAIGVYDPYTFREECSEELGRCLPGILDQVHRATGPWLLGQP